MRLTDLLLGRSPPSRVAAVYPSRESAIAAVEAAKDAGDADDERIHLVGPLEQVIGNDPTPAMRGSWAVIVEPDSYPHSSLVARTLRHSMRRRRVDRAAPAEPQSESPAEAGLVVDRP